jgi:hypothetical protein
MDWTLAITRNRDALLRIVAALFALAGLAEGQTISTLPRHAYRAILRVLRPAESAVRRLIVIAARGLVLAPRPARAFPADFKAGAGAPRVPAFQLIDPLKTFAPFSQNTDDNAFEDFSEDAGEEEDAFDGAALPRISVPGFVDPVFCPPRLGPSMNDPINAAHLIQRLAALKCALGNLPKHARRLARWQARRGEMLKRQVRGGRVTAFRPGRPPGYRARQVHEIDRILRECHGLALDALDTS